MTSMNTWRSSGSGKLSAGCNGVSNLGRTLQRKLSKQHASTWLRNVCMACSFHDIQPESDAGDEECHPRIQRPNWPSPKYFEEEFRVHIPKPQCEVLEIKEDWRAFRARLVAAEQYDGDVAGSADPDAVMSTMTSRGVWAHKLAAPEKGCLLVAKDQGLGFFEGAVVLVVDHDDRRGTVGLTLNKPSPARVSDVHCKPHALHVFNECQMFVGGPVYQNNFHVLHGVACVDGARKIVDGVYMGGLMSAGQLVQAGAAHAAEFHLLAGYAGWRAHQLAAELHDDMWHVVAASPAVILHHASLHFDPHFSCMPYGAAARCMADMHAGILQLISE